jgi:TetR/AcrR family acrAB operon transcriptional repressor
MRRPKELAAETREQVLDAALVVFARKGYAATTLVDIAQEAGLTRGAVYHHFEGKPELYLTLLQERSGSLLRLWSEPLPEGTPLQNVHALMLGTLRLLVQDPAIRALLTLSWFQTELVAELESGFQQKVSGVQAMVTRLEQELLRGQALGEVSAGVRPREAALAAVALTSGFCTLYLMDGTLGSLEMWSREVGRFVEGLR